MRNILYITILTLITIIFTSCGNSDSTNTTVQTEISHVIVLITDCYENNPVNLQTDDTIVKDEDGTTITILHKDDDTKTVCVDNGSAHIVR